MDYIPIRSYCSVEVQAAQDARTESARHAAAAAAIEEQYPGVLEVANLPNGIANPADNPTLDAIVKAARANAIALLPEGAIEAHAAAVAINDAQTEAAMTEVAARAGRSHADIITAINVPAENIIALAEPNPTALARLPQAISAAIVTGTQAIRDKWGILLSALSSLVVGIGKDSMLLTDLRSDGLISDEDWDALWNKRNGSQAEAWYGAGFVITEQMIGEAINQ